MWQECLNVWRVYLFVDLGNIGYEGQMVFIKSTQGLTLNPPGG